MKEQYYDQLLNIHTDGKQKGFHPSLHYNRYEPTPYEALEILFEQYVLKNSDRLVDFGCGKGRLNFLVHHLFGASAVGIEMDETFYEEALENKKNYIKRNREGMENIHFQCCLAEEYKIDSKDNRFYFFNPFSQQIFMRTINNILRSVEQKPRDIELILYYAPEDYIFFLENQTAFELKEEIILGDLYEKNPYEKFLIYHLV
ncbi:methyltransferase domain-containing protein [Fictibacillus phosphorivorans]|uniref:methyltransferase domain-containing protein n=1 Tax=Fictibacillus phosphorivorans TaxID=1221500 RepID=UPI00203BF5C3|nr:methyltransferase domain-containing protein [Fictibacillus phosphorivorans]MCM3719488.1 class I SAM-dependent methyltransferase [Fictibacillus phosphorivorans]MCM3777179.1 class I SAM-dependent methyltransferase [Fictibacillus phosphorivorans]